jgi:hypothetical protein
MTVGQKLLEYMLEKHGNMKILPNTQRLGKLTFDSNQVRKSKTNPNVLIAKASDGKDYGVVRKDDGSYDYAGSSRNATFGDRMATASANPNIANRILDTAGLLMSEPQRMMTRKLSNNKYNSPSEFIQDSKLPQGLKNTVGLASDMIADPSNLVGAGTAAKAVKLAMMLPAIPALAKSSKVLSKIGDAMQSFKSEANWNKWNPETLKRPDLLEEYDNIEKSSKADGSWLKSIDGKPWSPTKEAKELGLEKEQYLSQSGKGFKKAYPEGFDLTYRGSLRNIDPELRSSFNNNTENNDFKTIFSSNDALAEGYANKKIDITTLTPMDKMVYPKNITTIHDINNNTSAGKILPLIHGKGKNLDIDVLDKYWGDVTEKRDILQFKNMYEGELKRAIDDFNSNKSSEWLKDKSFSRIQNILYKQKLLEKLSKNPDNITNNKKEYDKIKEKFSDINQWKNNKIDTNYLAKYLEESSDLNKINLKNINDSGLGDVTIVKHKLGYFLKSSIGNVGDYDMNNPNIHKGIVPGAIAAGAAASTMSNKDKNNKFKYGGKLLPLLNKF